MTKIIWTPQAFDDLEKLFEYVARDSPHFARLLIESILHTVERLEQFPRSGRVVPERQDEKLRELLLGSYRIVYRLRGEGAEILMVFHGSRLLP